MPGLGGEGPVPDLSPPEHDQGLASDAPLAELSAYLEELRGDEARLTAVGTPRSMTSSASSRPTSSTASIPQRLRGLLDQVGPLLFERLIRQ